MKPAPPYYAVIFTSVRADDGPEGYEDMADRMVELAHGMPGFLGHDSVRGEDGLGITVSYWRSQADITAWRHHAEHAAAIKAGRESVYRWYESITARVERVSTKGDRDR